MSDVFCKTCEARYVLEITKEPNKSWGKRKHTIRELYCPICLTTSLIDLEAKK